MYYFLAFFSGILISLTVLQNGELAGLYGLYASTVFIHLTGLLIIGPIVLFKKDKPFENMQSWHLYLGGAVGLITVVCTASSFGRISVSAIMALGLLSQSITGLFVDRFGLMGMPRYPFYKSRLIGLIIILSGIVTMINNFEILAVALSLFSGVTIIVARSLNGKLAELTSIRISSFYNYVTGIGAAIIAFLLLGGSEPIYMGIVISPNWYIYFGGTLGLGFVAISNVIVPKISAFSLTLFLFVGQVFSGLLIDSLVLGEFSTRMLVGGLLVAAGLITDLYIGRNKKVLSLQS